MYDAILITKLIHW